MKFPVVKIFRAVMLRACHGRNGKLDSRPHKAEACPPSRMQSPSNPQNMTTTHPRKGIILAGGTGSRLHPLTIAVSKQLMPIYDKPMVYYPLSTLMLTGIREIILISTPHDLPAFRCLLGTGAQFGLQISYAEQPRPEGLAQALIIAEPHLCNAPSMMILGDNLFYGHDLVPTLRHATARQRGATIFAYHVDNPADYGVVEFDPSGKVLSIEEKPLRPKSNYAIPGIYIYDEHAPHHAKTQTPSARGELEITDLNNRYLQAGELYVEKLGRGTAWLDTGTVDNLLAAAEFVHVIEKRQGLKIACPEEIAYNNGWISRVELQKQRDRHGKAAYGNYLERLLTREPAP